jgi:hypothetical protein
MIIQIDDLSVQAESLSIVCKGLLIDAIPRLTSLSTGIVPDKFSIWIAPYPPRIDIWILWDMSKYLRLCHSDVESIEEDTECRDLTWESILLYH